MGRYGFRFRLHGAHGVLAAPLRCLADQFRFAPEHAIEIGGAFGPDRVQRLTSPVQRLALVGHRVNALRTGLPDRVERLGVTLHCAVQAACTPRLRVMLALLLASRVAVSLGHSAAEVETVEHAAPGFRRGRWLALPTVKRESQAIDDPALSLCASAGDFRDALADGDAASLGKS